MSGVKRDGILGVFVHVDALVRALRACRDQKIEIRDVYSPVPNEEVICHVQSKSSPVRFMTLIGAVVGLLSGYALALLSTAVWEMFVSGKPLYSLVPYTVVGFEVTILFGAIGTLVGLLFFARLPFRGFPSPAYRPEFSNDRFGMWIECSPERVQEARAILSGAGAVEVQNLDGQEEGKGAP